MKNLFLIKLGGSLITDKQKPFTERLSVIKRLCREIHDIRLKIDDVFIIGHGGGSFPHHPAKKYKTQEGLVGKKSIRGIAEVQDAASKLNRIVIEEFLKAGENAISYSPSSFLITGNGKIKKAFLDSLLHCLDLGMLPIVYGDVTFDTKKGCNILSTEEILNFLALKLKGAFKSIRIIYCGITDGVYDEEGNSIKKINSGNFNKIRSQLGGSHGVDVTGGMIHKVEEALSIAKKSIPTVIINGIRKNELMRAIRSKDFNGTYIRK